MGSRKEYKEIITDILTTPKYLLKYCSSCIQSSFQQLVIFKLEDNFRNFEHEKWSVYKKVKLFFNQEFSQYISSKQQKQELSFKLVNCVHSILITCGLLCLILIHTIPQLRQRLKGTDFITIWMILSGIIINAIVVVSLSRVAARYQSRVIWLIIFVAAVTMISILQNGITSKKDCWSKPILI